MWIYISKYIYFYEVKKWQNYRCHCIAVQISKGSHNFSCTARTLLSLPGPSCTVQSMHHHCWREQNSKGDRIQCACQSDTQSSAKARIAVRVHFPALVSLYGLTDTGCQYTDTLAPSHKTPCTTRQSKGQYNQWDLSYQKGFDFLWNTRILMFS